MIEVIAELPNSGISVLPGQEILIQTIHDLDDQVFTSRAPRIRDKLEHESNEILTGLDINLVPWRVSRSSRDPPGSLRVKIFLKRRDF